MPQVPRRKMPNIDTASMTKKESAIMTKEDKQKYEDEVRAYNSRMHNTLIKPMLALDYDKADVVFRGKWKFMISPKIDGVRCIVKDGVAYTRTGKVHRNKYIQERVKELPQGYIFDGELIVGKIEKGKKFSSMTEGLQKICGKPDFVFCIFDIVSSSPHYKRYTKLVEMDNSLPEYCYVVEKFTIHTEEELNKRTEYYLDLGYEGAMLNEYDAPYKHGRAGKTHKELIKVKTFSDAEALVIGYTELENNLNPLEYDELGKAKRSTSMAGKVKAGLLGSLRLRTPEGVEFSCAGFTDDEKAEFWAKRDYLEGMWVKYKYFKIGADEKPRFPTFLGFRDKNDF